MHRFCADAEYWWPGDPDRLEYQGVSDHISVEQSKCLHHAVAKDPVGDLCGDGRACTHRNRGIAKMISKKDG